MVRPPPTSANAESFYEENFSLPLAGIFVFILLVILYTVLFNDGGLIPIISGIVALVAYINVYSCRISVAAGEISVSYGLGLFTSGYSQGAILKLDMVPNTNLFCWIYTPRAENSVYIVLRDGGVARIPCYNCRKLIEKARSR